MCSHFWYILKIGLVALADGLNVAYERKEGVKDNSKGLAWLEWWSWLYLRWAWLYEGKKVKFSPDAKVGWDVAVGYTGLEFRGETCSGK